MTYHARITAEGYVIFPDDLAAELQLRPGSLLEIERDGSKLVLKSFSQVVKETQQEFRSMLPPDYTGSLVDELIADRREEARREDAAHEEWLEARRKR